MELSVSFVCHIDPQGPPYHHHRHLHAVSFPLSLRQFRILLHHLHFAHSWKLSDSFVCHIDPEGPHIIIIIGIYTRLVSSRDDSCLCVDDFVFRSLIYTNIYGTAWVACEATTHAWDPFWYIGFSPPDTIRCSSSCPFAQKLPIRSYATQRPSRAVPHHHHRHLHAGTRDYKGNTCLCLDDFTNVVFSSTSPDGF